MNAKARKTEQLSFWQHVHTSYGLTGNRIAKTDQQQAIQKQKGGTGCSPRGCGRWRAPNKQGGVPQSSERTCPDGTGKCAQSNRRTCLRCAAGRASESQAACSSPSERRSPSVK